MLSVFLPVTSLSPSVLTDIHSQEWGPFVCEMSSLTLTKTLLHKSGLSCKCPKFLVGPFCLRYISIFRDTVLFLFNHHSILNGLLPFCSLMLANKQG